MDAQVTASRLRTLFRSTPDLSLTVPEITARLNLPRHKRVNILRALERMPDMQRAHLVHHGHHPALLWVMDPNIDPARLQPAKKCPSQVRLQALLAAHPDGLNTNQIAEALDIMQASACNLCNRLQGAYIDRWERAGQRGRYAAVWCLADDLQHPPDHCPPPTKRVRKEKS